ncbi:MAG TPA: AraC family transcriptional regulator [Ohtaekwangia sp.]|nr:AraC family transcriptional regulator [Ohtaekwangia sp.]
MQTIRKREGFEGQRAIVLPKKIIEMCGYTAPINSLYITDIGFYPRAAFHYRERSNGVSQCIVIYCTEGKGWLEVPTGRYTVEPNHFVIIPPDIPHKYGADEENPWTIYWAHFKGIQASSFAALLSGQFKDFVAYSPFLEERLKIFDTIYESLESGYSHENLAFSSISFGYLLASFCYADKFASAHHVIEKDLVDQSIDFMRNNIHKSLSLEEIASSINLSVSHYSSIFRKKTGYSPVVYFNHLKIQHACQYLHFTNLRINEIAPKLGIEDPYYFSRMFTKIMGVSPLEYRNKKH